MNVSDAFIESSVINMSVTSSPLTDVTSPNLFITWDNVNVTGDGLATVKLVKAADFVEYRIYRTLMNVFPFLPLVIGTLGNLVSLVVLTRPAMRHSSSCVYMTALAVFDTLAIWCAFMNMKIARPAGFISIWFCRALYFLQTLSNQMSAWLVICMTAERFVAIYFPLKANNICTVKNARVAIVLTLTFFIIFCGHYFETVTAVPSLFRCTADNVNYAKFLKIWAYVDVTFNAVIPEVAIMTFNILIVRKLRAGSQERRQMTNAQGSDAGQQKEKQITVMLLTVSFTFFLLVTPYCVFFISRNYWVDRRKPHIFASAALVNAITFCLMQTNNSINFFLYFLTGQRFRNELKAIVCGRKPTKTMTTSMSNIMSSTTNVSDNTQM